RGWAPARLRPCRGRHRRGVRALAWPGKDEKGRRRPLLPVRDAGRVGREGLESRVGLRGQTVAAARQDAHEGGEGEVFDAERQGGPIIGRAQVAWLGLTTPSSRKGDSRPRACN